MPTLTLFFVAIATLALLGAVVSFLKFRKYNKETQPEPETKPTLSLKPNIRIQDIIPLITTPIAPKETSILNYVTIDGEEPEEPTNFIHSKKFIAIAGSIGLLFGGYISYIMFFVR
jgi:hypothetical protein